MLRVNVEAPKAIRIDIATIVLAAAALTIRDMLLNSATNDARKMA